MSLVVDTAMLASAQQLPPQMNGVALAATTVGGQCKLGRCRQPGHRPQYTGRVGPMALSKTPPLQRRHNSTAETIINTKQLITAQRTSLHLMFAIMNNRHVVANPQLPPRLQRRTTHRLRRIPPLSTKQCKVLAK